MASTYELCQTITKLGGDSEALSDKLTKTLSDEIIRLLSIGSKLDLDASRISYGETDVDATLDSLSAAMAVQQSRVPTSAEVLSAIQSMTDEQITALKTKLNIQ